MNTASYFCNPGLPAVWNSKTSLPAENWWRRFSLCGRQFLLVFAFLQTFIDQLPNLGTQ